MRGSIKTFSETANIRGSVTPRPPQRASVPCPDGHGQKITLKLIMILRRGDKIRAVRARRNEPVGINMLA